MNVTDKCSKCGKAKEAPGAGMATQLLDLCICAMQEKEQMATISICATCGKRIATRDGSMTQWIFGSEKCGCIRPIINEKPIDSFVVPGFEDLDSEGDEKELEIDPDSFPLQRYKPLIELGKGASGTVYLCRDRLLKKRVAIKTLHAQNDEQLVSFQEEAKNTAKMNHPNIVKILDFGATDAGTPYMVMDYVPGISLEKFIEDWEKLSPELAVPIFEKLAEALIYAHDRRTFHRDIKPSNIILLESGDEIAVQLIDFGIAKVKETTGSTTTYDDKSLAGTPYYMAPDLILNKKYDARSEVYSLGCVLFEALSGKPPFVGESVLDVLNMHANKEAPRLEAVPEELSNLVLKCLSKEQEKRFESMTDFKDALVKTISSDGKPDSQTVENEKERQAEDLNLPPERKNRSPILLLVSATAILAIGLVAIILMPRESDKKLVATKAKSDSLERGNMNLNLGKQYLFGEIPRLDNTVKDVNLNSDNFKDALVWFNKAAREGNSEAKYYLGIMHEKGLATKKSLEKAIEYYKEAADAGVPEAQAELGAAYYLGEGVKRDYAESYKWTVKAEEGYIAKAFYYHGLLLSFGHHVKRDLKKAAELYGKAAAAGYDRGEYAYGTVLLTGAGVDKNQTQAVGLILSSAQKGYVLAQSKAGQFYHHGMVVGKDIDKAIYWYQKAALQNDSQALFNLGCLYHQGIGVDKDIYKARQLYASAIKHGSTIAYSSLGLLYLTGPNGIKNEEAGIKLLEEGVKKKDPNSCAILATCYLSGEGTAKDIKKGNYMVDEIIKSNDPAGPYILGMCYLNGIRVKKDINRARTLLKLSADKNYAPAIALLKTIK